MIISGWLSQSTTASRAAYRKIENKVAGLFADSYIESGFDPDGNKVYFKFSDEVGNDVESALAILNTIQNAPGFGQVILYFRTIAMAAAYEGADQ